LSEEFDSRGEGFSWHAVEGTVGGEEVVSRENVEVGVENQVVTEGVDGGDSSDAAIREVESCAEDVLKGGRSGMEEVDEEVDEEVEGLVDGWHSICSYEHILCGSSLECGAPARMTFSQRLG
jgi:hypothetical protein